MFGARQRAAESEGSSRPAARENRAGWMGVLARADWAELSALAAPVLPRAGVAILRAPEVGMAMLRGQAGSDGTRFHLAEITVTRCAVRVDDGPVGHAYVRGRCPEHARVAALCDALLQMPDRRDSVEAAVIDPLLAAERRRHEAEARAAGRTRVEFFTLARET